MRLKCIKLAGFKSFVDPTRIDFPGNLTAIVGPNGCGKSNVIDAVRWVMGESSARHLRGQAMTDVIFNGSGRRNPVGQCTVELQFDNSAGTLVGPYAEYNEISVKRRVTRDGQSTYFLNGSKCRRRDITDLFAGTGLGPRSYAIIEQGMISRLIEARPEELRVYIEEAAGISRYKDRRRETENRMRRTRENLERLHDIQSELARQLSHLQRQAKTAETYQQLKSEEKQTRARLMALRWRDLDAERATHEQNLYRAQTDEEAVRAELRKLEADMDGLREAESAASTEFQEIQKAYYEAGNRIARLEQQAAHQQDRLSGLRGEAQRIEQEQRSFQSETAQDRDQLQTQNEELEDVRAESARQTELTAEADLALENAEKDYEAAERQWLERNEGATEIARQMTQWQTTVEQTGQQLQQLQRRRERLQAELENADNDPAVAEIRRLEDALETARAQLESVEEAAAELDERVAEERAQQQSRQALLSERQAAFNRDRQALTRLQATLEAHAGDNEQIDTWLQRWQWHNQPTVLDRIKAEPRWQNALEWVLGTWLQGRLLPVEDLPERAWESLPETRAAWLFDSAETAGDWPSDSLAARVEGPVSVRRWLAGIRCADTAEEARNRRRTLAEEESVICPEGLWLGRDWGRIYRAPEDNQGILARREEMETLAERLDDADFELEDLQLNQEAARQSLEQLERDQSQQRAQREDYRTHVHALERDLSARRAGNDALAEQLTRTREDLAELDETAEETRATYESAQQELKRLEAEQMAQGDGDNAREARDAARLALEDARAHQQEMKRLEQALAMQRHGLETRLDSLRSQVARSSERSEQLARRAEEVQEAIAELAAPDDDARSELEAAIEAQLALEEDLGNKREQAEVLAEKRQGGEQARTATETRLQSLQEAVTERSMALERVRTRQQGLEEQLREQAFDLATLLGTLDETATAEDCERTIEALVERIRRLGPINLAAIDEFAVQQERQTYLSRQQEDLERALETLTRAIARIDRETRNRFKETYDLINAGLQDLFPRMFGGGHAYLAMTGEDLLDTGVAIMAQPPGKKNATIHLLSGGEKALTAIALVFSIFRLNPSPFCMLDEVDAPLDDANVMRYSRLVEAMADQVEFIFITHNKVAMEIAERLLGVTMNEPGVSRLVSVNVDEAVEMATQ